MAFFGENCETVAQNGCGHQPGWCPQGRCGLRRPPILVCFLAPDQQKLRYCHIFLSVRPVKSTPEFGKEPKEHIFLLTRRIFLHGGWLLALCTSVLVVRRLTVSVVCLRTCCDLTAIKTHISYAHFHDIMHGMLCTWLLGFAISGVNESINHRSCGGACECPRDYRSKVACHVS